MKIRTKVGRYAQPFRLNRSQAYLHERLEKQLASKGKVRALVLKGRQVGISTYISGRQYWRVSHNFGRRGFVLTHLDTASDNLFGLIKRFHETCPAALRPQTKASNAKELSFGVLDSGYKVATAGSAAVGRFLRPCSYFTEAKSRSGPTRRSTQPASAKPLPMRLGPRSFSRARQTASVMSSIGNGRRLSGATATLRRSSSLGTGTRTTSSRLPGIGRIPPAFREYRTTYGLTAEQLYWAWLKNRELAVSSEGGSDEICWRFRQEYPANADEAFQTGGIGSFIPAEAILRARKGNASGYGPIIIGVDPARGGPDKTGIVDRHGRRLGGHICKRINQPDLMALAGEIQREVKRLVGMGHTVKVVIDATGLGAGLGDRLRELLGDTVECVNFGSRAYEAERYANRRAEMHEISSVSGSMTR